MFIELHVEVLHTFMPQIIIVSNRLPVSVKRVDGVLEFYPSVGGLATGLSTYTQKRKNSWIGWPGIPSDELNETDKETITTELAKHNCYPVFLSKRQLEDFYNRYSNGTIWPLFHNLPVKQASTERHWKAYREVNKLFAEAVINLSQPKSTIWVHDYHLLLLPEMLRAERPKDNIGLFLHIPFPDPETLSTLPEAKKILRGMLGADLAGFHTAVYADNFVASCQHFKIGITASKQVILEDRTVRVTDFPMGIDYDKFAQASKSKAVKQAARKYKLKYRKQRVILTVDRVDPTKGLVERLQAYKEFLRINTNLHKKVVMAMLAMPSRTEIKEYQSLTRRVEKLVAEINNTYGTPKWQPVDYMYKTLPFEEVTALYQIADVAFIAPLKDGMNLVAKEYVASQNKNGVLILSETAGAAHELTEALIVNPKKRDSLVEGLTMALQMPRRELRRRSRTMQKHLASTSVQVWANNFMKSLQQPVPGAHRLTRTLRTYIKREVVADYRASKHRLLLLDYDGVLTPFFIDPEKAAPERSLYKLIEKLAKDPANEVVLVSGRTKADLVKWFGDLPVSLAAEHGAFIRKYGKKSWKSIVTSDTDWQSIVLPIMEKYTRKTPKSFVEVKESTLVWHYRQSSPYSSQKNLVILKRLLKPIARANDLTLSNGNKILEIKAREANKGLAIMHWLKPGYDFVLALGDDDTDEDMFASLPLDTYTIKVGRGRTAAKYRLNSVTSVLALLKQLTK
jgi:trehalose 6-phosphate synthase/phosphatase